MGGVMRLGIATAVLLVAGQLHAQVVHKCTGKGGSVSYQSEPCTHGQAVKTWVATPEAPPTNAELWRRYYAKKKGEADSRYLRDLAGRTGSGGPVGSSISSSANSDRCASMRSARAANVDNNTGFDGRRAWNDAVADACK